VIDERVGTRLGNYRIESLIGQGGMGVVYLAQHLRMSTRKAAIKVLAENLASDEEFRERFIRESDLAGSLDHPNIIPVYDADETNGLLYIAMRFVEGTDLKAVLEQEGRLHAGRTLAVLEQVASALDFAHERGLVHRDVKPGNIMIEARHSDANPERVFLADFGLVKRINSQSKLTHTGYFIGTLDYAAPEVFRGGELDGRADVYALGCVLFECLSGSAPFPGTVESVMYGHLMNEPPILSSERPDLPPSLDGVVQRALAKSKEDRYPTCHALVTAARDALSGPAHRQLRDPATHLEVDVGEPRLVVGHPTEGAKGVAHRSLDDARGPYADELPARLVGGPSIKA